MPTSYVQVVNRLLETHATEEIIVEADREIVRFNQPTYMSRLQYADALWMETLHCPQVYDEYILNGTFFGRPTVLDKA